MRPPRRLTFFTSLLVTAQRRGGFNSKQPSEHLSGLSDSHHGGGLESLGRDRLVLGRGRLRRGIGSSAGLPRSDRVDSLASFGSGRRASGAAGSDGGRRRRLWVSG